MSSATLIDAELAGGDTSLAGSETLLEPAWDATQPPAAVADSTLIVASGASLNEESHDGQVAQSEAALTEESAVVLRDSGLGVQSSLPTLAVDEGAGIAPAGDITGSAPAEVEAAEALVGPAEVQGDGLDSGAPIGLALESHTLDTPDPAAEAASSESGMDAPAAAMAMSIDSGAAFDGTTGAYSLVYDGCWGDPLEGGERVYYDDGTIDWAYTKPYVIGDATGDISYDILPLPVDEGVYVDGSEDWTYADEWDNWDYVENGEDWVFVEEGDEWIYADEDWTYVEEDWSYVEDGEDWIFVEEGDEWLYEEEDWIDLDEWEDWSYADQGDESVSADEGGGIDVISDPEIVVCWGYPELMYRDAGSISDL